MFRGINTNGVDGDLNVKTIYRCKLKSVATTIAIVAISMLSLVSTSIASYAQDSHATETGWAGSFLVRGHITGVMPEDDASYNVPISTDVTNEIIPEFDISYFLTDNIAFETICCATRHEISLAGGGPKVGSAVLVPLMLVAQYHFHLKNGFKPYIGAGPTATIVASDKAKGIATSFDLDTVNYGLVLQAGVDIKLKNNWYFNIDVKKLYLDLDANVFAGGAVVGTASIDPWIAGIGIGYRF